MRLILTHLNSSLPSYIYYNFKQLRVWNPDLNISLICHTDLITKDNINWCNKYSIHIIPYEIDDTIQEFLDLSWYDAWGTPNTKFPSPPKFVQGTSERLYALESYCRQNELHDVFHIENDVLLYCDLNEILLKCQNLYSKMTITPMAEQDHTFAFVYIPQHTELTKFIQFNTQQLEKGNDQLRKQFGMDMVHEMSIVKIYKDLFNGVDFFPILPEGPYSTNFNTFNSLFDPASWGQYICGTNNVHGPGYAGKHHIIGRELLAGKYGANICNVDGKCVPMVNGTYKLNNLHVHSKQLEKYV